MKTIDLEYQRSAGGPLLARIYQPEGSGPFPCIVDVHGGGWGSGDRLNNALMNQSLAQSGIVIAALDFRLAPQGAFPASVADVNLGIRWLKVNAASFGSRPDLVGGLGTSSGGHQLLLNALRPKDPLYASLGQDRYAELDASLRYVVACWPVADPLARFQMARRMEKANLVQAHVAYWASDEDMRLGNPQLIVENHQFTHLPPVLILQGTSDDNLTPDMAERFAAAYRAAGGDVEALSFAGQPHAFITRAPDAAASIQAMAAIERFIKRHSAAATAPSHG
jgi:acetyl esterase/lipase